MSSPIIQIVVHIPGAGHGDTHHGPVHHTLRLPVGAVRWEISHPNGQYQPIKFIAVYSDGTVAKIVEYASGQWSRYESETAAAA